MDYPMRSEKEIDKLVARHFEGRIVSVIVPEVPDLVGIPSQKRLKRSGRLRGEYLLAAAMAIVIGFSAFAFRGNGAKNPFSRIASTTISQHKIAEKFALGLESFASAYQIYIRERSK